MFSKNLCYMEQRKKMQRMEKGTECSSSLESLAHSKTNPEDIPGPPRATMVPTDWSTSGTE